MKMIYKYLYVLIPILIAGYYYTIQQGLINGDLQFIFGFAQKILDGKILYKDIFDVNPPLIIYYHLLSLLLSEKFSIGYWNIFVWSILSLTYINSFFILKILYSKYQDTKEALVLFFVIIFLYLVPIHPMMFGQREHLFMIFTLPYILMSVFGESQQYSIRFRILIALLATLGFNIKPYFYIIFIFLEIINAILERRFSSLWRIESIIITSSGFLYLAIITFFFSDYLQLLPIYMEGYALYNNTTFLDILRLSLLFYLPIIILFSMLAIKHKQSWMIILVMCMWAALFIYVLQAKGWMYHIIPFFAFVYLFCSIYILNRWKISFYYKLSIIFVLLTIFPLSFSFYSWFAPSTDKYALMKDDLRDITQGLPDNINIFYIGSGTINIPEWYFKPSQHFASRFIHPWMASILSQDPVPKLAMNHLIKNIYEDLETYRPEYIIAYRGDKKKDFENDMYQKLIQNSKPIHSYLDTYYLKVSYPSYWVLTRKKPITTPRKE